MSLISKCNPFQRFNQKLREHSIISFLTQRVSFSLKINSCASQICASKGKWRVQPRLSGRDRGLNSPNFASTVKSSLTLFTLLSVFWSVLLNSNCKFILSFSKICQVFMYHFPPRYCKLFKFSTIQKVKITCTHLKYPFTFEWIDSWSVV